MDKYTVDLDKVLNDFEYSELTDQYSVGSTSQPLNNVHNSSAQRQQDLYKLRNPPIKHTINNVFQSLNEYLNTDIGAKSKQNEFSSNNIKDTNIVAVQDSPINAKQGFTSISTTECVGLKDETEQFGVDLIAATQSSNSLATNDVFATKQAEKVSNGETPSNCNHNVNQYIPESSIVDNITSQTLPEETPSALLVTTHGQTKEAVVENTLKIENLILDPAKDETLIADVTYTARDIQDIQIQPEIETYYSKIIQNNPEVEKSQPKAEEACLEARSYPEAIPEIEENHTKSSKNYVPESSEVVEEAPKADLLEIKNEDAPQPSVVGFDESFGLDDSELHHYLDELEHEYEAAEGEEIKIEVVPEAPVERSGEEVSQMVIPAVQVTLDSLEPSDINQETEPDVDDNNLASRPSTLQINNQTQIDLIGEPGSTPYNNMYISKTLPVTEPVPESDSESSPSASPTFSDVSTDTAGSTATTESVTDSIDDKTTSKLEPDNNVNEVHVSAIDGTDTAKNLENISNNNVNGSNGYDAVNEGGESAYANATVSEVLVANDDDQLESENKEEGAGEAHSDNVGINAEFDSSSAQQEIIPEQNSGPSNWLGKQAPLWIPDSEALNCLHCDTKFTVIKRRHHCRACGLVLCSKCCNMKLRLEYLEAEARVCLRCYDILNRDTNSSSGSEVSPSSGNSPNRQLNQPNPNNPMEYCSMVPPLQQVSGTSQNPPTVMVPVGVLKRKGSAKSRTNKSVMFCDGIRPGSELTNLDNDFNYNESRSSNSKKGTSPPPPKVNRNAPAVDATSKSFIPNPENSLPPTVTVFKSDISYTECANNSSVVEMLKNEPLTFALQSNLHVHVKIINMDCCINKWAWCFTTEGMITVGQDEIVLLLEFIDNEKMVPKDMFFHLNSIYNDAKKGTSITEYGISLHGTTNFLESKNHIGFLYIRPTFQCLQNVIVPKEPYLIGILVHRWEMPWAKIFPLRLILRLGAEYRYYPSPIISTRQRESVFVEIGHTIINLLADFRNFTYTLPNIRGLSIHMEEKNTTVTIPSNRYDQVMKSISNSSDHILAFGGNFSVNADSHLVCIQDTHGNNENTYTTHAINIHNRPRKVTGASFIVFNGALKSSSGLTAKSSIVEDGLMIQIPPEHMLQIRDSLRNMKNHTIQCGCINATSDETVNIVWGENDVNFNTGVLSSIDNQPLGGIPSIRVHNGKDYVCNSGNRMIRWTEVFILQNGDESARGQDIDFSKLAESISKATCQALVKYLDLLSSNNFYKIGIRTTLHVENVSYSAGSNGMKLPPIYMKSLDNELIPVLHRITSNNLGESAIVLELVFRILNV